MPTPDDHTEPIDDGAEAERTPHVPDSPPTDGETHAADVFLEEQDPADVERVAAHHREMDRIGAEAKGEGEIA
jgi:hypothetical protein